MFPDDYTKLFKKLLSSKEKVINLKYVEPNMFDSSFNCPHCFVLCPQKWYKIDYVGSGGEKESWFRGSRVDPPGKVAASSQLPYTIDVKLKFYVRGKIHFSVCTDDDCGQITIWFEDKIVYPENSTAPLPHKDMPPEVREVYEEARHVFPHSVRAACALLRLSLEYLMDHLNVLNPNDLLGKRLKYLIDHGQLPNKVLKAMESVRVYGNDLIHNVREIRTDDDHKTALQLFRLVNFIIEKTITEEKMIQEIYDPIPQHKKRVPEDDAQKST